jgi:hypothetical protein
LGHVEKMEDNAMPKRMLKGRLYSKRRKRRPGMRWLDDVESDLKKMEVCESMMSMALQIQGWL